ncbi:MAG TPA: Flp pilus assembly protein CpaB [Devosia sp.]
MRANTFIMLALAVVFGVAAVFVSNIWLGDRSSNAAAVKSNLQAEDMIVVAAVPLNFGDRLTPENTREIPWTASALPAGSFKTRTALLDAKLGERQVLTPIGANEPIIDWKITGPGQRATLSATLAEGMKALSIRVNDVLGVAGFVLPGDRVDILLSRTQGDNAYVDVLLQDVKVLAIDQTANEQKADATVVKTVTLEVATLDAQKLTLAGTVGTLSLALREVAGSISEATQRVTLNDLNNSRPAPVEAQGGPLEPVVDTEFLRPSFASVGVVRGMVEEVYEVPLAK